MGFVIIYMEVLNVFVRNLDLKVMELFVKVNIIKINKWNKGLLI